MSGATAPPQPHSDDWRLRPANLEDVPGLHSLACKPQVYRYLFDGVAPEEDFLAARVEQGRRNQDRVGLGLWILEAPPEAIGGCVELQPDLTAREAELTYFLEPNHWGQGLALRMAWTAITAAFRSPAVDCVFAGVDAPNSASLAVMTRLGMAFRRDVVYPLGPGLEYQITRGDPDPKPRPALLPLS